MYASSYVPSLQEHPPEIIDIMDTDNSLSEIGNDFNITAPSASQMGSKVTVTQDVQGNRLDQFQVNSVYATPSVKPTKKKQTVHVCELCGNFKLNAETT